MLKGAFLLTGAMRLVWAEEFEKLCKDDCLNNLRCLKSRLKSRRKQKAREKEEIIERRVTRSQTRQFREYERKRLLRIPKEVKFEKNIGKKTAPAKMRKITVKPLECYDFKPLQKGIKKSSVKETVGSGLLSSATHDDRSTFKSKRSLADLINKSNNRSQ